MCFLKGLVCIFVSVSLDHFDFLLLVLLVLAFSVPSQEIGWEERLRNDLFCHEHGDVKPCSIISLMATRSIASGRS